MTPDQLVAATGCSMTAALAFAQPVNTAIQRWGVQRVPEFVAQIAVESARLTRLQENLNYTTAHRLMEVWPRRFPTYASALPYVRNPEALANLVYGNRADLGNTEPGDGWRYRGRGLKQITGRANYTEYQGASQVPCVVDPDLLLDPVIAADSAGWFWHSRGCDALADNLEALTRRINGGLNGFAERVLLTGRAREALRDVG